MGDGFAIAGGSVQRFLNQIDQHPLLDNVNRQLQKEEQPLNHDLPVQTILLEFACLAGQLRPLIAGVGP